MLVSNALLVSLIVFGSAHARSSEDAVDGCTPLNTLPNMPFLVVWNTPSEVCEDQGVDLNLTAYGIITNKDDRFYGEKMTIFYDIGEMPYFVKKDTPVNGGLPQLGNVSKHIDAFKLLVENNITNLNFNGLAVLDWESWRPHLQLNFDSLDIYINKSIELVKQLNPTWTSQPLIVAEATRQFDTAARAYMQETLEMARNLRPYGYWGYYGFPRCWDGPLTKTCGPNTAFINDAYMGWLFSLSSGLYPRIYTWVNTPAHERYVYVRTQVNETLRVQVKWSGLGTPVLPYTRTQDSGVIFFEKEDLEIAINEPAAMGASGVVIWGSHEYFNTTGECNKMKVYIKEILGPFVKNLTDFYSACARDLCNNHGRCVRKDFEATTQEFLRLYGKKSCLRPREEYENLSTRRQGLFGGTVYRNIKKYDDYICRCLPKYHGEFCDKPI